MATRRPAAPTADRPQPPLDRIDAQFESLSPALQKAARWVRDHPLEAGLYPLRECARRARVPPAALTRVAQSVGFDGFESFRAPLRAALSAGDAYADRARALQTRNAQRAEHNHAELHEHQRANLDSIARLNTPATLQAVAQAMLASRRVAVLGLRASFGIAAHLHYTYQLAAGNSVLLTDSDGTLFDQLDLLSRDDLLVAITIYPYTRRTVEAVRRAAQAGIRVVALTDSAVAPIARGAWQQLLCATDSASFFQSMVGALALAETLVAEVAICGGRAVVDRLQRVQQRLNDQQAYWDKYGDRIDSIPLRATRTTDGRTRARGRTTA
jgi:DNA-binding MurR/RpiR family transcriptional regulator